MTSREPAPVETITEWGVCATIDGHVYVSPGSSEEAVRHRAGRLPASDHPTVVCRTVTRTEWREVSEGGAPDA